MTRKKLDKYESGCKKQLLEVQENTASKLESITRNKV